MVVYGTIYTAEDENDGLAQAFAVKDGKYIYVGSKDGVKEYIKDGKTEVIDRTGEGLIIPGCTDGHSHYSKYRDEDGKVINLFGKRGEFAHTWVAFYK